MAAASHLSQPGSWVQRCVEQDTCTCGIIHASTQMHMLIMHLLPNQCAPVSHLLQISLDVIAPRNLCGSDKLAVKRRCLHPTAGATQLRPVTLLHGMPCATAPRLMVAGRLNSPSAGCVAAAELAHSNWAAALVVLQHKCLTSIRAEAWQRRRLACEQGLPAALALTLRLGRCAHDRQLIH